MSVDPKFAETVLKDALEGIHKAAATRLTAIGVFSALVTGASAMAMQTRSYGFMLLGALLLLLLVQIEFVLRKSHQSYNFRYIQAAHEFYGRSGDYAWLSSATPQRLLDAFAKLAADNSLSNFERGIQLRALLGFWRHLHFSFVVLVVFVAYTALLLFAALVSRWPFLPQ